MEAAMINKQLIEPESILVVGASNNIKKPGGKVLKNIIDGTFTGRLYAMNPKEDEVQGVKCFKKPEDLPQGIDLAIISIPAKVVPPTVEFLAEKRNTKAFIVLSAGFSETGEPGEALEAQLLDIANTHDVSLIGPNCMGILTTTYQATFAGPIPNFNRNGVDFASGSGATAAFIMEAGIEMGLPFASMYSVGNSAQNGVEDIVKYWDESFEPQKSTRVKLLYLEKIDNPQMFYKHTSSLINKGCKIAAIKAGASEAGNRAASSHTGALASSDEAVEALFRKAGVVRCYGREELMLVGAIFSHKELKGKNLAIVTHAGGPGVMISDTLSKGGFRIPPLEGMKAEELLSKLYPGSSVSNPVDFLATGTAKQLGTILDYIEQDFDHIDGTVVIFGTPGLFDVSEVYKVLDEKMTNCKKPIFPILPSIITAKEAVEYFRSLGRISFSDEVLFGQALVKSYKCQGPVMEKPSINQIDQAKVREILNNCNDGYLPPINVQALLDAANIPRVVEAVVDTFELGLSLVDKIGFPVVLKAVGPVHKTDIGGVSLNINKESEMKKEFERLMQIKDCNGVLVQPMIEGTELYVGAKREENFGHVILAGLGGIFIEVFKDVASGLTPIGLNEAEKMINSLKSRPLFEGVRGLEPIDKQKFAQIISNLSSLLSAAPEIVEMDINPLLAQGSQITAVDARIKIQR
jgi:acyl-CoA synthetase (NDP forming)